MVITTEGIQFLKELPGIHRCKDCPAFKFCPRGPIQDFCIDFLDIETVINFPQMPQKIVIKFKEDLINEEGLDGGQDFYQVTLTIPSFTKCAKIFQNLVMINRKSHQDRLNIIAAMPQGGTVKAISEIELAYMDRVVNFQLMYFIDKLTDAEVSRQTINGLQLIIGKLKSCSLLSKKQWDEQIPNKVIKEFKLTKRCKPMPSSF